MDTAESLPQPNSEPVEGAEVLHLHFDIQQSTEQEDIDQLLTYALSEENQAFVLELAKEHQVKPLEIINSAIASYANMVKIIESGGRLNYIDPIGRLHPIDDSEDLQPPAV